MKKKSIISFLLMMTLVTAVTFTACGNKNTEDNAEPDNTVTEENIEDGADEEITEDTDASAEEETNGDEVIEDSEEDNADTEDNGEDAAFSVESATAVEVIENIYTVVAPEFGVYTDNVDASDAAIFQSFTGLSDSSVVSEAAFSESMIGSQAYSLVVVRVADSEAVADVAAEMKAGIDTRKWICVEADDMQVVSYGDVVLLIMVSSEYAETITSQSVVDAFAQLCGGEVTVY